MFAYFAWFAVTSVGKQVVSGGFSGSDRVADQPLQQECVVVDASHTAALR